MKFLLIFWASFAFAQSELGTSAIRIMPRAADSDTGSVRFLELYSNPGGNRIDLRAPQSIHANKILRVPSENSTLVAQENHRYGSAFYISGYRAEGTEASPANVSNGSLLFQFSGYGRVAGTFQNIAALEFSTTTAPETQASLSLNNGSSYGARYIWNSTVFYPLDRPTLGASLAAQRWGTIYSDSLDLLVPTGTTPQYETGSFIRAQTLELHDITGLAGGFGLSSVNDVSNSYLRLVAPDGTTDLLRAYSKLAGASTRQLRSYSTILPDANNTYNFGSDALRWNQVWGTQVSAGTLRLAGNSNFWLTMNGPGSMSGNVSMTWPSANASGVLTNDGSGALSWGAGGGGSGSAPLDEAIITDYGAATDCSVAVNTAWANAKAALPRGGIVTFPPGCYGVDGVLSQGNGSASGASSEPAIILQGAGSAYNPSGIDTTTEIRWIGSAPGSITPMVRFAGPINGGGIRNVRLNANGVANVRYVEQLHHAYGRFESVWATRSPVNPSWVVTTVRNNYPFGSCYNRYDSLHITHDLVAGGGGMHLTGGVGVNSDACSNTFTGLEIWYDGDSAGTYGIKLDYTDNNTFLRPNFFRYTPGPDAIVSTYNASSPWAVSASSFTDRFTLGSSNSTITNGTRVHFGWATGGALPTGVAAGRPYFVRNVSGNTFQISLTASGSIVDMLSNGVNSIVYLANPGVLFERHTCPFPNTASCETFPKENTFVGSAMHLGVWGVNGLSGTGGNTFLDFARDDCFIAPCIPPELDHIYGSTKGQQWGSGTTPPGASFEHTDSQNTFIIGQTSGLYNGAGSIAFQRTGATIGRIRSGYFDGLVFSTSAGGGAITERWRITDTGNWFPSVSAAHSIGNSVNLVDQFWGRSYNTLTPSAYGAQNHTFSADANVNLILSSFGGTGNDNRAGINFYRNGGTFATPSSIASGDRLGVIAFWGNAGSGLAVGGRINVVADSVSAGVLATSLRFATQDLGGTLADRLTINPSGAATFTSTIDANTYNALGSPAYRVSGTTIVDASRNMFGVNIEASTGLFVITGGVTRFSASGGGINLFNSGGTNVFSVNNLGNVTFTGAITTPSGLLGANGSVSCGTGQAVKSMTISFGLVTSVTCGIP